MKYLRNFVCGLLLGVFLATSGAAMAGDYIRIVI